MIYFILVFYVEFQTFRKEGEGNGKVEEALG